MQIVQDFKCLVAITMKGANNLRATIYTLLTKLIDSCYSLGPLHCTVLAADSSVLVLRDGWTRATKTAFPERGNPLIWTWVSFFAASIMFRPPNFAELDGGSKCSLIIQYMGKCPATRENAKQIIHVDICNCFKLLYSHVNEVQYTCSHCIHVRTIGFIKLSKINVFYEYMYDFYCSFTCHHFCYYTIRGNNN